MKTADVAKSFIIPLHVFPFDIFVSIGQTDAQFKNRLKRYNICKLEDELEGFYNLPGNCQGKTSTLSNGSTVLRLSKIPKTPDDFGIITHEIFHAVDGVMKQIGVGLSDTSEEVYAYLTGYITTQIYKRIIA